MEGLEEHEESSAPPRVPRFKVAVVTWVAIYPALTVTLALFSPVIAPLPLPLRTLVLTVVLVPIMVYVLVPTVQRLLAGWLVPRR
jgi:uncharacterized protein